MAQLNLPVKVVVFRNDSLSFVELEMKASGFLDFGVELKNPDFAALAQAAGLLGLKAETAKDVRPMLQQAFKHDGPGPDRGARPSTGAIDADDDHGRAGNRLRHIHAQSSSERPRHEIVDLAKVNLFR